MKKLSLVLSLLLMGILLEAPAFAQSGRGPGLGLGPAFVDADGNGICDRFENPATRPGPAGQGMRRQGPGNQQRLRDGSGPYCQNGVGPNANAGPRSGRRIGQKGDPPGMNGTGPNPNHTPVGGGPGNRGGRNR